MVAAWCCLMASRCSCWVDQHAARKGGRTRTGKTGEGMDVSHSLKSGLTSSLLARSSTAASSLQQTWDSHASRKTAGFAAGRARRPRHPSLWQFKWYITASLLGGSSQAGTQGRLWILRHLPSAHDLRSAHLSIHDLARWQFCRQTQSPALTAWEMSISATGPCPCPRLIMCRRSPGTMPFFSANLCSVQGEAPHRGWFMCICHHQQTGWRVMH